MMFMEEQDLLGPMGPFQIDGLDSLFDEELLNVPTVEEEPQPEPKYEEKPQKDLLGKLMTDLDMLEPVEELQTAGIGITEDPFFNETSKAANLFQENQPVQDTQELINEMEEFLNQQEQVKEEETSGEILEALEDSGFVENNASINNLTEMYTQDGQRILIVIANPDGSIPEHQLESPEQPEYIVGNSPMESPMGGTSEEEDFQMDDSTSSDSDWTPGLEQEEEIRKSKRSTKGRSSKFDKSLMYDTMSGRVEKTKKRGPYAKRSAEKQTFSNVKDKKERKKLQNVVAARRYRDKKKNELFSAESEEDQLREKNMKLKEKMSELEGEVKTLKKLVFELGLVKKSTKTFLKA